MRLDNYLNEWKIIKDYAGRGISNIYKGKGIIIFYYLYEPIFKGLIWTKPNGDTYLNNKKMGIINYPNKDVSHKKQLADFYTELGFGKFMTGNMRDDVETMNEMNVRGRIVGSEIHIYRYEQQGGIGEKRKYEKLIDKAINAIYKYIPEDYEISEKYFGSATLSHAFSDKFGGYTEVFANPSKSEMDKLGRQIRFYADLKKKIFYAFKLYAFHMDVWNEIIAPQTEDRRKYNHGTLFFGVAEKVNGKWEYKSSDECGDPDDFDVEKMKWIEKYINLERWIEKDTVKY